MQKNACFFKFFKIPWNPQCEIFYFYGILHCIQDTFTKIFTSPGVLVGIFIGKNGKNMNFWTE